MSLKRQAGGSSASPQDAKPPTASPAGPDDFTRAVKKRLSSTTRTGQACDRCKVRKIRCDGLSGGCSPCRQNNTECRTTDRISQRAIPRGYIEELETKCADYEAKIKELEAALASANIAPPQSGSQQPSHILTGNAHLNPPVDPSLEWGSQNGLKRNWDFTNADVVKNEHQIINYQPHPFAMGSLDAVNPVTASENQGQSVQDKRPKFRIRNSNDHVLGMYSSNSYLNSMKASALSVLGIDIDLSNLIGPSEPPPKVWSNGQLVDSVQENAMDDSLQSCLLSACNADNTPGPKLDLPPKEEALRLVEFYFMATQPYLPMLHKPSFMAEFNRMYDIKHYRTTPAQTVIVHMVIAITLWQLATRHSSLDKGGNTPKPDTARAYRHYHFSLSLVHHLLAGSSLEDCQAICSILIFTRSFARPGPSYILGRIALAMVLELGLHRSTKKAHMIAGTKPNVLEDELRKRIFWVTMAIEVGISAKLGRPIAIRPDDYDVEYPERIEDENITEAGFLSKPIGPEDQCSFDVGLQLFRIGELTVEIHTKMYAVEKPSRDAYGPLVESLEAKMTAWKESLPKHLRYDPLSPRWEVRIHSANLMLWYHELRILLRHPSQNVSASATVNSDNLTICVESSRQILDIIDTLRKDNHLDTTWYATTVPLLASLTILFSIWEKRDTITQNEIQRVKVDMELANNLLGEYGKLHGSTNKLGAVVASLTESTMAMLDAKHNKPAKSSKRAARVSLSSNKSAANTQAQPQPQQLQHQQQQQLHQQQPQQQPQQQQALVGTQAPISPLPTPQPIGSQNQSFPTYTTQPAPQPSTALYVDPNLHIDSVPSAPQGSFDGGTPDASASSDSPHSAAAALSAVAAQQQQQYMFPSHPSVTSPPLVFAGNDPQQRGHSQGYWLGTAGAEGWKEYLSGIAGVIGQADGYSATEALMALGQQGQHQQTDLGQRQGSWAQPPGVQMNMYDFNDEQGRMQNSGNSGRSMGL